MVSAAAVTMWTTWTAAVIFVVVGCAIGLANYSEEWARTTGVVLALVGMLFLGAASVSSVWIIAQRRSRQVCEAIREQGDRMVDAVELNSDVKERLRGVDS